GFKLLPVSLVRADLPAPGADRDESAQPLHLAHRGHVPEDDERADDLAPAVAYGSSGGGDERAVWVGRVPHRHLDLVRRFAAESANERVLIAGEGIRAAGDEDPVVLGPVVRKILAPGHAQNVVGHPVRVDEATGGIRDANTFAQGLERSGDEAR